MVAVSDRRGNSAFLDVTLVERKKKRVSLKKIKLYIFARTQDFIKYDIITKK